MIRNLFARVRDDLRQDARRQAIEGIDPASTLERADLIDKVCNGENPCGYEEMDMMNLDLEEKRLRDDYLNGSHNHLTLYLLGQALNTAFIELKQKRKPLP